MQGSPKRLATELRTFNAHRGSLVKEHRGEFALVKGRRVVGCFNTMEAAFEEGVARFGLDPFLVKEIVEKDRVLHFVYSSRTGDG